MKAHPMHAGPRHPSAEDMLGLMAHAMGCGTLVDRTVIQAFAPPRPKRPGAPNHTIAAERQAFRTASQRGAVAL